MTNGHALDELEDMANQPLPSDPQHLVMTETAGSYTVSSAHYGVRFTFDQLLDERGGVSAELIVMVGRKEILPETSIGLRSGSARDTIARTLKDDVADIPFKSLLARACGLVLRAHRQGEPVVTLTPTEHTSTHVPYVINPLVYENCQTIAFAPGGSCKSYLALYFALLACHGVHQVGVSATKVPVLYLDWELNEQITTGRLKALQNGHPELSRVNPFYRRCRRPLHQDVHRIALEVARKKVRFVVIDSAALACGGDLSSPDSAIKLQQSLDAIGSAALVLAHVPKSVQEGQETSPYGTVFFRELARNVWEVQRAKDSNPARIALHQKKDNFNPPHPSLGFELTFSSQAVRVAHYDPTQEPEFEDKLPVPARIRNYLEGTSPQTAEQIAEGLRMKLPTVKSALSRGAKERKWMMLGGAGQETKWTVLVGK